ncbi:MAG TPA: oligosaccharide flippase family protein, partial [Solirubrobacteraceae bacterium]
MHVTGVEESAAAAAPAADPSARTALRATETAKAVGLAAATMGANVVAVAFTIVFTRLLGTDGYGALAALLNLSVILFVPGSALQVAAAREGALGRLGHGGELAGTLLRWMRHIALGLAVVAVASALLQEPLAALLNVEQSWAAAAVPPTAALWFLVCIQRGLLQSARAYRPVGLSIVLEAIGRLAVGAVLVAAGLSVTGAYLGTLASLAITAAVLAAVLRRRLGPPAPGTPPHPLRSLVRDAAVPIGALTVVAALQNVDVIMARHALDEDAAGIYAAATVAAKAVVWIAVGIGLYVLPEATRRAAEGLDPRTVLARGLAIIVLISGCALAVFAAVPRLLLKTAFGEEYADGATILFTLGAAFALLACAYIAVQFLLGLRHRAFALVLLVVAAAEPVLLLGADDLEGFART